MSAETGDLWVSIQTVDFGRDVQILLRSRTHYAEIVDGQIVMHPFATVDEGVIGSIKPTLKISEMFAPALLQAIRGYMAPSAEERSREFGRLEGELSETRSALELERVRIDKMIAKLLGDTYA